MNRATSDVPAGGFSELPITRRGRLRHVPALRLEGVDVVISRGLVRTAYINDEFWLPRREVPSLPTLVNGLRGLPQGPDLLSYAQRVPDVERHFDYPSTVENYAVLPISTFDRWMADQIPATTRRHVRGSAKRGIAVRECAYDDDYVRGISSIYNETPFRAGRRYWHYGKDLETVRRENGTYAKRSTFLAAFAGEEMVGYTKIVWDEDSAAIMQILSKISARDARPNNAMLAEAVRACSRRGVAYLIYEKFDYGKKLGDSLTRFKASNGFVRMEVPRYYVPLTATGRAALSLGLHREMRERVPEWIAAPLRNARSWWFERQHRAE